MLDRLFRKGQHYPKNQRKVDPEKTPEETQALIALSGRFERNDAGRWVEKGARSVWNRIHRCLEENPNPVTIEKARFRKKRFSALVGKAAAEQDAAHDHSIHWHDKVMAIKKRILETVAYYPGVCEKSGIFEKWIDTSLELDDLQGLQEKVESGKFTVESEKIAIHPRTGRFDAADNPYYSKDTLSVTLVNVMCRIGSFSSGFNISFLLHPITKKLYYFPGNPYSSEAFRDEEYKLRDEAAIVEIQKLIGESESG